MKIIIKIWNRIEKIVFGGFSCCALLVILYAVFMRYVMGSAPEWSEEVAIYMTIWSVYLASSTIAENKEHIGATFIFDLFPSTLRRLIKIVTTFLGIIFSIAITYYGFVIVRAAINMGEVSETSLRFPMWLAYLAVPVGFSLLSLRFTKELWLLLFQFTPDLLKGSHEDIRPCLKKGDRVR
ncbi:TRAP transporter small permease [Desulfobacula sp.]|uniref:TRAP transporter small permease n=1 Tax=Desulfobacula sp. TaxID=2593537 RepID=UPI002602DC5B|nr:TRAP transporter small permease [Desulfobacula sp.]